LEKLTHNNPAKNDELVKEKKINKGNVDKIATINRDS
jgi:hypothetical protein